MTSPKRPLKVFLCHAHADRDAVRGLYTRLTKDGVDAWLDKEKLLPGQDWELEIRKAVREADVVVVCLSKQFNQAGFRQKEVRLALDTAMEKPEGEIFIIPARLEECDTLESLRKWHWVDLFEPQGYKHIIGALQVCAKNVGAILDVSNKLSQDRRIEMIASQDATIDGWVRALGLREQDLSGHALRVAELTLSLAREMKLPDDVLLDVRRGALLHDIGKMGVPDRILLKNGKLTDEEWAEMKKHPQYAYDMLSDIDYLHSALDIPYCHHENWDGTGFPRGLKGEEIPLSARIFAVVDVYDILMTDRPYRQAFSKDKTLNFIHEQAGKQFDPRVVDAFIKLMRS